MKVSIAWIFDHIDADWKKIDIEQLVSKFNETTAEIEGWYTVKVDIKKLYLAQVKSCGKTVTLHVPDLKKDISLAARSDLDELHKTIKGPWYLIKKERDTFRWATSIDLGGEKEMILPAVKKEAWKQSLDTSDYILDIDNKSITHRPDLWGHRGFAREIAALLNLKLKPIDKFLVKKTVQHFDKKSKETNSHPFTIVIEDPNECNRFAGLYIPDVSYSPSLIWMVGRLSRIDSRSINALVDFTNYVMFDTSQPMHAFDGRSIPNNKVIVRQAHKKEELILLDDQKLALTKDDMVIADKENAISLAGIMGGKYSGVWPETQSLFLESANFNPATIRKTSQRYHLRSDASARFEKSLDPMQNVDAILRYIKLMEDAKISYDAPSSIVSVGKKYKPHMVVVSHEFIERRLGVSISSSFISKTLKKIGFEITTRQKKSETEYHIVVPLYRATKDIHLPEDIVEEVGRFYGYSNISFVLPERKTIPTDQHAIRQRYNIKHMLAYGLDMHELQQYSLFDESFMRSFGWQPNQTLKVQDPVSENWSQLVTTLMPQLFKAVCDNAPRHDELRFFEFGRIWHGAKKMIEEKKLTGIFFNKRMPISFVDGKAYLEQLFAMLNLSVVCKRMDPVLYPWFSSQSALLVHNNNTIGVMGVVDQQFLHSLVEGYAFIFELDADFLVQYKAPTPRFKPLTKYPHVERDISMLVPIEVTVESMVNLIGGVNKHIESVFLIDLFEKKEWPDQKAMTLRYIMRDPHHTLTGEQADKISDAIQKAVKTRGAAIR